MTSRPIVPSEWSVEIEAAGDLRAPAVDGRAVEALIDVLADHSAAVSHRPRCYSTRMKVYAHDALEAVADGVKVWKQATEELGLPDWPVVRVEAHRVEGRR